MTAISPRRAAFIEEAMWEVAKGLFQSLFIKAVEKGGMWLWRMRPWRRKPKTYELNASSSGSMVGRFSAELI